MIEDLQAEFERLERSSALLRVELDEQLRLARGMAAALARLLTEFEARADDDYAEPRVRQESAVVVATIRAVLDDLAIGSTTQGARHGGPHRAALESPDASRRRHRPPRH